jgi:RNA polymerase sigma factor (sigma-70 family)
MVRERGGIVGQQLEVLWTSGTLTGMSDAQLVSRFTGVRDTTAETAFRELVHRHGPMVMGVCRQILRRAQDAEDAFQATFLILVRKARSVQVRESLAPWLYSVAFRTAQRARASGARYRQGENEQLESIKAAPEDLSQFDLRPLIHEELGRLPDKFRSPIVLCHLEGKTHEEAARVLNWPVGTVSGRLSRGRELLRSRLERRGVAVTSGILGCSSWNLTELLPESVVDSTLSAATRFVTAQSVSTSVQSLTHGVLKAMLLNKLKTVGLALLVVGGVSGGALAWARRASESPIQTAQSQTAPIAQSLGGALAPVAGTFPFSSPALAKNAPTLADFRDPIPVFGTGSILLVETQDGKALEARSVDSEDVAWQKLAIPAGLKVTPVAGEDTLALMYKGESIAQLAAFSAYTGEWSTVQLVEPVHEEIAPAVGPGSAVYQAGNIFYAFSSQKGAWDVLQLPAGRNANEKPRANLSTKYISVQQGDQLYVFSLKHGKWSKAATMKLPAAKKAAPAHDTLLKQ